MSGLFVTVLIDENDKPTILPCEGEETTEEKAQERADYWSSLGFKSYVCTAEPVE